MRTLFCFAILFVLPLSLLAQAPAPAPTPAAAPALNLEQEMETLFADAQSAFTQGKFDVALQKIGAIHTKTSNKDYEMVMFLEGACHFNLKAYDKAVTFFEDFIKKFPESGSINDAKMAVGEAYLSAGQVDKGIEKLKEAAAVEELRDKAGLMIANQHKKDGKPDDAIGILEAILKELDSAPTQEQQAAILMASDIYVAKGETEKAQAMMEKLNAGANADDTVVQRNIMAQKVGDSMLEEKRYNEALRAYQSMRRYSELLRIQKQRITRIQQWQATLAQPGGRVMFLGKLLTKEEAEAMLAENQKMLQELEGVKDYDANIFYRLGQCFYEMQRYYEAILAFGMVVDKFSGYEGRDGALFGTIACNQALGRSGRAADLCKTYVRDFPEGKFAFEVTNMLGTLFYQSGRIKEAVDVFRDSIARAKTPDDKERLNFMLGVVLFEFQQFDEARLAFQTIVTQDAKSAYADASTYYIALSYFFQNDSKNTRRSLRDYIAKFPKGEYVVDAQYRLAFIEVQSASSGQGGDEVAARKILEGLTADHPNDANIGQVWYLLGDLYGKLESTKDVDYTTKALEAYRNAVDKAKTPDVMNVALDAADALMQERSLWKDIIDMWTVYYNTNKGKPEALKAIHKIAIARERLAKQMESEGGNPAEAKELRVGARKLVAGELLPHLGNPASEQVEMLIQQLVSMMVPKKRPRAASVTAPAPEAAPATPADGSKPAEPAPAAPAPVVVETFEQVEEEFKKLLTPEEGTQVNGTAAARILYGRALIARGFRDVPKFENLISVIPDAAKAEELSPLLLATLGEIAFKKGEREKATEYYSQIRAKYPNSEFGDKAPIGLGEIEFQNGEYQKALDLFNEAIEKYAFSEESMLDGTLGKAKSVLALRKFDEAEKLYTAILNTREWRSAHAGALLGLAQVWEGRKETKKAIEFYRRVILAHRKDKPILAKAYLGASKGYIELGGEMKAEARKVLDEMLRQKDLTELPEFAQGQTLIGTLAP
ncbi:MAG: tetratricopeptide repeat protein [Roseimicrobium sp.]